MSRRSVNALVNKRGHAVCSASPLYPDSCNAPAHAHVRFRRAIQRRALWLAEDAAHELPNLPLEDALQLVHLYAERGSP
jgi:hypothetical protein